MRRDMRILLGTVALGGVATWGPLVPQAISSMQTFQVSDVEVRGLRFLTEDSIIAQLELVPASSVWGDKGVWTERLLAHRLVRRAEVRRRIPNGLLVTIEERRPIALAATPTLEPLDVEGFRLPIDPARYRLDLPIITGSRMPPTGSALFGEDVRLLAGQVEHLMTSDLDFVQRVSTLRRDPRGSLVARLTGPDVDFLLPLGVSPALLREGQAALNDALSRNPAEAPQAIDLRFADQVVVRRGRDR
ncbi:MAG: FtsQ-type POTRA domain-containing protein [Gemmatimonadetes bacterium]|nr:FtsQ-type POTRA domain-containing protein [Gemmatimonadota bacterium]MDA1102822.1 FtsQ-type POTRA domain-containing protein [Gemmatimonadota bacterium]